jgi:hypothetical protein
VDWLRRGRRTPPQEDTSGEPEEALPAPTERGAPGIAATFAGLKRDGGHAILDLGPAAGSNLRLYSGFARWIRIADLLTDPPCGDACAEAFRALPTLPERPYDLVLAWNLLDRLAPEERPLLIRRLAEVTAPGARLSVVVDASGDPVAYPLRFTLLDFDRVSQQAMGPPEPAQPQLMPGDVGRVLEPFEVVRAFTVRLGLREYVAVRE